MGSTETLALSEASIDFLKSASRVCMWLSVDESGGVIWKRLLGWKKKKKKRLTRAFSLIKVRKKQEIEQERLKFASKT